MRRVAPWCVLAGAAVVLLAPASARGEVPPEVMERYWECRERHDLDQARELLWYHHNVERVDASVYGLPADDLDDPSPLTIEERLAFRAAAAAQGVPLATSGRVQYPHHLRHSLDHFLAVGGARPDCSEILAEAGVEPPPEPEDLAAGWASDLNLTSHDARDRGEVHVAVDRASPNRLIATSVPELFGVAETSSFRQVSTDWGQTWARGQVGLNAGTDWECDPVSYYQRSTGKVYHGKIGCPTGTNCNQYRFYMRSSTDGGLTWADCGRPGSTNTEDREWITVDNASGSPCYGTLYGTWHSLNSQKVARSTDECATWGNLTALTANYTAIIGDVATAADGHAYVLWHNYASTARSFRVRGSTDCGVSWGSPAATVVKSKYGDVGATAASQCQRGIANQVAVDVDRAPGSAFFGRVYAAMFDMSASGCLTASTWSCASWDANWSNTCNWDVWLAYSDDDGATWRKPSDGALGADNLTAAEGNTVDHLLGFMRVDDADGSIYLAYHRSRLAPAVAADRQKTHYFVVRSTDGGATFEPAVQASTLEGDERSAGFAADWERGDYQGVDVHEGVAWPIWIDRRGEVGAGGEEEIVIRKLCSEPAHWSERAPTFVAAPVTVTGDATVTVSWQPPDLYWGDGNEDPSARKYQLWVDGVLVEDNIPAAATSTTHAPGDLDSHAYTVRAVNQCGVHKDYQTTAHPAVLFADGFESGGTDQWSAASP